MLKTKWNTIQYCVLWVSFEDLIMYFISKGKGWINCKRGVVGGGKHYQLTDTKNYSHCPLTLFPAGGAQWAKIMVHSTLIE